MRAARTTDSAIAALVIFGAAWGCATTGGTPEPPDLYKPDFTFQPEEQAEPAEADVTFALIRPEFAQSAFPGRTDEAPRLFSDFSRSFLGDFQELLAERGYSVTGPYESYEQMTYPQRKQADLVLVPQFQFGTETLKATYSENVKIVGDNTYSFEGTDRLSGHISLAAQESLTGERMWFQNIDLPSRDVSWSAVKEVAAEDLPTLRSRGESQISRVFMQDSDPGVVNPIARQLENYYSRALQATWDYVNPEEMQRLKSLADSLKADYEPGRDR